MAGTGTPNCAMSCRGVDAQVPTLHNRSDGLHDGVAYVTTGDTGVTGGHAPTECTGKGAGWCAGCTWVAHAPRTAPGGSPCTCVSVCACALIRAHVHAASRVCLEAWSPLSEWSVFAGMYPHAHALGAHGAARDRETMLRFFPHPAAHGLNAPRWLRGMYQTRLVTRRGGRPLPAPLPHRARILLNVHFYCQGFSLASGRRSNQPAR